MKKIYTIMKKLLISTFMLIGLFITLNASAQYRPTQKDVGNDCTTHDGKLGTWKNVRVEDSKSDGYGNSNTTSGSMGGSVGNKDIGNVSGSVSQSNSNSRNSSESEKVSYDDIRCVEDKNATLPQRSPVRW